MYKDLKVKRPTDTKIQTVHGYRYVYKVLASTYNKDKKYYVENRVLVGKMIDDTYMIPNDNYFSQYNETFLESEKERPTFSDTVGLGSVLAINKIFDDLKLTDMLKENIYSDDYDGNTLTNIIKDLVSYMLISESSVFQHYESYARRHIINHNTIINDNTISNILNSQISFTKIAKFLKAWCEANINEDIYISYDSTNINSRALGITLAEYGHAKDDKNIPQVNISCALNQNNGRPLFFEVYKGSIVDMAEFSLMVEKAKEYGINRVNFLADRGYFSKDNLDELRHKKHKFLMMAKSNNEVIRQQINLVKTTIKSSAYYLFEHEVNGIETEAKLFKSDINSSYIYVYFSKDNYLKEKKTLLEYLAKLEKELKAKIGEVIKDEILTRYLKYFDLEIVNNKLVSFKRDANLIDDEIDNYGYFSLISSHKLGADKALDNYMKRDSIEKLFRMIKSDMDLDTLRVHSDVSVTSKVFLAFIGAIVRNELLSLTKELRESDKKNFTVNSIIRTLDELEISKNSLDKYVLKYALTSKQKKIFNALNIKENLINKTINTFNNIV